MNECRTIHETIIKDIIDIVSDIKELDPDDILDSTKRSSFSTTSIAKLSSNLTLVFPVICSSNLTIESASMTAKAIERKAVVMLQMLFSAYQITDAKDAAHIIAGFHKNIKLKDNMSVDELISVMDSLTEGFDIHVSTKQLNAIKEDMKNINFYFEEDTSTPLTSYEITRDATSRLSIGLKEGGANNIRTNPRDTKDAIEGLSKRLLNSDIKKANELVPSTMVFSFNTTDSAGNPVHIEDVVIGVKAKLVLMESNDIITHVLTKVEDRNWLLQYIRATTREISFVKDFLFAIDRAKIDALSRSNRGSSSPMWKVLERRSIKSKLRRAIGRSNDVMAITTIAVSQEEVDYVKKEYNTNFEDYSIIAPVMEAYNLMGFVILDESLEVGKFLFDTGDAMWENISFTGLEREAADNSYKKIVNLMTKVSR